MESLPVIVKSYELYKGLVEAQQHLSKNWRHSLGLSSENSVLQLMEELVMAKNAPKTSKTLYLIKASATLEVLTMKLRLLLALKLVNPTLVFQLQAKTSEIGRMLGGWLKSVQSM